MAQSQFPFHGIFSSLGQNDGEERLLNEPFGADEPEEPVQQPKMRKPQKTPAPQHAQQPQQQQRKGSGQVAVDIYEQDGYYIIKAPIAGVRMADIDIEVTDNVLIIRGERRQPDDVDPSQYLVQECFWGAFERRVTLPGPIDQRRVKATFNKESILKILVPREREEKIKIVRVGDA